MKNAWFYFYSPGVGSSAAINMKSFLNTLDSWQLRHCAVVMPQSTREMLCLFSHWQLHIIITNRFEFTNHRLFAESAARYTVHRKCDTTRIYFIETNEWCDRNKCFVFAYSFYLIVIRGRNSNVLVKKWWLGCPYFIVWLELSESSSFALYFFLLWIRISLSIFSVQSHKYACTFF